MNDEESKIKINNIIQILEFILLLEDEEITKSSIESVIEMLKEI
jgi:hypothetical protein